MYLFFSVIPRNIEFFTVDNLLFWCSNFQESGEENHDMELDEENDYLSNYFETGESYLDEDDNLDDGPTYWNRRNIIFFMFKTIKNKFKIENKNQNSKSSNHYYTSMRVVRMICSEWSEVGSLTTTTIPSQFRFILHHK